MGGGGGDRDGMLAPDWLRGGAEMAEATAEVAEAIADIWATVELERALRDLGLAPDLAAAAVDDPLLGARVVTVGAEGAGGDGSGAEHRAPRIALAEPSTEGRLAAFLARHGEGRAGRYVGVRLTVAAIAARAAAARITVSRPATGPFGRSVLVLDGPASGLNLILVEIAAVPSRP